MSAEKKFLEKQGWTITDKGTFDFNGLCALLEKYKSEQFQTPTDALNTEIMVLRERVVELEAWKESAKNVLSNLKLQELGKVLDIKLGEDIAINVLPKVNRLIGRIDELEGCLRDLRDCRETWSDLFQSDKDKIESLINKSK